MKKQPAGRRARREQIRRKKIQVREKVGKSQNTVFFSWFCGSGGLKSRLAKAAGAETSGEMRDEKLHALWREAHFEVKMYKAPWADHFWKLRCRKSARRCGAKHICKWKCTNTMGGPLLEVEMSKKCTALWREAHLQVKMYKTPWADHFWKLRCRKSARRCGAKHISKSKCTKHTMYGLLLEVQISFRVAGARDCGPCQKWAKRAGFVAFSTTTTTTPHYTPIHYTTLQLQLHLHYILLHYAPLHYTALNYTQLHYTTLHYITLHSTTLHYTTLHYTTLHYSTLPSTTLHYTTLHSTTLHCIPQHYNYNYTKLHYTTLHYTTLHSTTLHYITLHYTTLHYTEWHCTTDRQVDR